ncbi:MAG: T9SS type A sorting domain-containing protein [Bacteroidia bacterium]|nr:T9SS type A sorting domain-containing protein [Bacteroidia bacterium]
MKKFLFSLAIVTASNLFASHQEVKPWNVTIPSQEITLDNSYTISLSYKLKFTDTAFFDYTIGLTKASYYYEVATQNSGSTGSWLVSSTTNKPDTGLYFPTDSIEGYVQFTYNHDLLPYSFRNIYLQIRDSVGDLISQKMVYVYFTTYGTIEVWNEYDFEILKRSWDSPEQGLLTNLRVFIDRDSIPQSDVSDEDFNNDSVLKHYISIEGLPYRIPMMNITDMDSSECIGNSQLHKRDGCGVNKQKWIGTISGNVVAFMNRDNNLPDADMVITGIRVEIWDQDWGWNRDDFLNAGYTDNQGNFSIGINTCQNFQGINQPESGELELYVVIQSVTQNETIKVRNRLGKTLESVIGRGGNWIWQYNNGEESPLNLGTLRPDKTDCKPHLLHFANQCRQFVHTNVPNLFNGNPLHIMRKPIGFTDGSNFMLPGPVSNALMIGSIGVSAATIFINYQIGLAAAALTSSYFLTNFSRKDAIYRDFSQDDAENTAYHEFGHYTMWHLQDKSFNMQLPFKDHGLWFNSANVKLAWSEGWAEGFAQIMDIATRGYDGEAGFEGRGIDYENRLWGTQTPEEITQRVKRNRNNPAQFENTVSTGMASEMNIACALVDLFDGETTPNTTAPEWNDAGVWDAGQTDGVSLTFAQICQPLLNNKGNFWISSNVLQDIEEYANELVKISDCSQRSQIRNVFTQNRIPSIANPLSQFINSDVIKREETITFPTYKPVDKSFADLFFKGDESVSKDLDVTQITNDDGFFNIRGITPDYFDLNDNLNLNNGTLFLNNSQVVSGFRDDPFLDPQPSNNITANVCAETINVHNAGVLEIGDVVGTDKATMIVKGHSILTINNNTVASQPSIIRVNNNSKLIIEGRLDIFPNSRIILNGDNAILEIKGTLNVHDNATFTFEGGTAGSGHVVFNTTSKNNIMLGNNSRIRFVGANNNDRVMEVPAGAVFWTDNIQPAGNVQSTFEITDGFVALGNNALINIGTAVNLNRVRFYAEQASPARSICLWGQKHKIDNVIVENVSEGIHSFNTYGGNQLILKNVSVAGAQRALFSEGKGATLVNFESINNTIGIEIKASTGSNIFHSPKVHGALNYATRFTGNSSSKLVINKADYFDNINGVSFTGGGTLVLNCGRIHNILPSSANGNGINIKSGTLILADALGFKAGRVSFLNNKNTIVLSNTKHYLNSGYNDLSYKVGTGNLALSGSSSHFVPLGGIIRADNNLWDGINVPTTLCSSPPGGYQNYNLICKLKIGSMLINQCVNIPTSPIINLSQFTAEQTNRCVIGSGTGNDNGTIATSKVISTTHFNEVNLQLAVGTILYNMYNVENPDYPYMINLWAELLTEVSYTSPYSEEDYYYINLIENKMMEALGTFISNDTTLLQSQTGLPHFVTVIDAQNEWIAAVDEDTSYIAIELKNLFNFDKGDVYHLQGENDNAQIQWSAMQNWANDEYIEHTDYWLCQLQRENAIKNCGKNPDSIIHFPQCQYYVGGNNSLFKPVNTNEKEINPKAVYNIKENKISKQLTLYPNPTKTTVTAVLETSQKDFATINIYNTDGKCLKTIKQIKLSLGINNIHIPLADLPAGYYIVSIQTRNISWNEKILIE